MRLPLGMDTRGRRLIRPKGGRSPHPSRVEQRHLAQRVERLCPAGRRSWFESTGGGVTRQRTVKYTVDDPTLGDLRWIVDQTPGLPDETPVHVTGAKEYSQMDRDPATIVVHGETNF